MKKSYSQQIQNKNTEFQVQKVNIIYTKSCPKSQIELSKISKQG